MSDILKKILIDFSVYKEEGHINMDGFDYQVHKDIVENFLEYRKKNIEKAKETIQKKNRFLKNIFNH